MRRIASFAVGQRHVGVDAEPHVRPDRLAHPRDGLDVPRRVAPDLHLDRAMPLADALEGVLGHRLGLAERHRVAERDALAHQAAEERVDRRAEGLPQDVPERHLDPGLRLLHAVERAVHLLDEVGDAARILADHRGDERRLDVPRQEAPAPLEHGRDLADAGDAGVRVDEHDGVLRHRREPERGAGRARHRRAGAGPTPPRCGRR